MDIGQLIDDADLAEQRVIPQHLVHSLVLTAADKGAKHGTYALRLFPEVGPIDPEGGENDRGPNPDAPRKGSGDRAVLTENDVVRQFGEKAPRVEQFSNFWRGTLGKSVPADYTEWLVF